MAPFPIVDGVTLPATEATPIIAARQSDGEETITCDSGANLNGGEIAGIVIGSIAGTLLLLWLIRSCMNLGAPPAGDREKMYRHVDPEYQRRRHRSKRRSHSRRRSVDVEVPPVAYYKESSGRGRKYYV